MFEKVEVHGYDALKEALNGKSMRTIILFVGSVDPQSGKSWCPDCETGKLFSVGWFLFEYQVLKGIRVVRWVW